MVATTDQAGTVHLAGFRRLLDGELRRLAGELAAKYERPDLIVGVHLARKVAADLLKRLEGERP